MLTEENLKSSADVKHVYLINRRILKILKLISSSFSTLSFFPKTRAIVFVLELVVTTSCEQNKHLYLRLMARGGQTVQNKSGCNDEIYFQQGKRNPLKVLIG